MGNLCLASADKTATKFHSEQISKFEALAAAEFMNSQGLTSFVELKIACKSLSGRMIMYPFAVVYLHSRSNEWEEIGRTELIANTTSPKFVQSISVSYKFEEVQKLRFEVYNCEAGFRTSDTSNLILSEHLKLGAAETTLATIFGSFGQIWSSPLDTSPTSIIEIVGEEYKNTNAQIVMNLRCEKIENVDFFTKSDPFLQIYKIREDGSYVPTFKTEVKLNNLNPSFKEICGSALHFANGDFSRQLKIECLDYEMSGNHPLIGEVETTLQQLMDLAKGSNGRPVALPLINKEKKAKQGGRYKNSGVLYVDSFDITERPSFLDYIKGGTRMSFIVGIDFTASNGDPQMRDSLHYVDPSGQRWNQYVNAIHGVGEVIEFYDPEKKFPVYGFGGKPPGGVVNHCFPLTGNEYIPEVTGVTGVLNAYFNALNTIHMSGPTMYADIIKQAVKIAGTSVQSADYQIYFDATVDAIIDASGFPLSILIVGIGTADFSSIRFLDSDNKKLANRFGKEAKRDIVQFVAM
eukprot:gene2623-5136_t